MGDVDAADFHRWVEQTTELLRAGRWEAIDLPRLIEEIEDLGKSERRAIASQLTRLILHLLKWQYQPQRRADSWLDSITDARTQIDLTLEDNPSLKDYPLEKMNFSYQRARQQAAQQIGLNLLVFPERCPYSLEQVLSHSWLPRENP